MNETNYKDDVTLRLAGHAAAQQPSIAYQLTVLIITPRLVAIDPSSYPRNIMHQESESWGLRANSSSSSSFRAVPCSAVPCRAVPCRAERMFYSGSIHSRWHSPYVAVFILLHSLAPL